MPGPVEVRIGNASMLPERRLPRLRELLGLGWRGADVKAYLLSYKETLSALPQLTKPSDIFLPLTELFFARSSFDIRLEMAEKAKEFALGYLGQDAVLEERITLHVLDRVIAKIDNQSQYKLRDILWLISDEAMRPAETIDQYFLERIGSLTLSPYLESLKTKEEMTPEDRLLLDLLSKPEILPHLETVVRDISKLELKGPERIKTIEKILLGLRELGLDEAALREAPLEMLRRAYLIGSLKEYALTGRLLMHETTWLALKNALLDPRITSSEALKLLLSQNDMRLFILGITGMDLKAEGIYSFFLSPLSLDGFGPLDINKLFERVLANGLYTDRLLTGLESNSSFVIEELSNYGKGSSNDTIMEYVCSQTDPIRTTEVLIDSLNEKSVGTDTATSLIEDIIKTRETEDEKEDVHSELTSMLERTDIPLSDRRMAAINQIFSWHPEAMGTVLNRYLDLTEQHRISSIPLLGYLSSAKITIDRLEAFILKQIEIAGNREMAKALLAALKAQASLAMSQKMSEALSLAFHYTGIEDITNFNLYYSELMSNQLRTIPTEGGQLTIATFLPRNLIELSVGLLRLGDEIRDGNLEAARQMAEAAVRYANENSLRAAMVRYLPAFLSAAIDGRLTEKNIEELKLAVTTDKNNGLFMALNLVQGILKNEVYTELENILKNASPINLPPRLAILGNILRDQHLTERENRFELARQLMEKMEKDNIWIKVLDMVETYQYDKAQTAIAAWVKDQLVPA